MNDRPTCDRCGERIIRMSEAHQDAYAAWTCRDCLDELAEAQAEAVLAEPPVTKKHGGR